MHITLVPMLLGGGTRLLDNIGGGQIDFTRTRTVETGVATPLWFGIEPGLSMSGEAW